MCKNVKMNFITTIDVTKAQQIHFTSNRHITILHASHTIFPSRFSKKTFPRFVFEINFVFEYKIIVFFFKSKYIIKPKQFKILR